MKNHCKTKNKQVQNNKLCPICNFPLTTGELKISYKRNEPNYINVVKCSRCNKLIVEQQNKKIIKINEELIKRKLQIDIYYVGDDIKEKRKTTIESIPKNETKKSYPFYDGDGYYAPYGSVGNPFQGGSVTPR